MTARADPSPLPPGVLLERERPGALPRRRATAVADVDLTAVELIDLTATGPVGAPTGADRTGDLVCTEFVGTESIPNRCQGDLDGTSPEVVTGTAFDEAPVPAEDGLPAEPDDEAPEQSPGPTEPGAAGPTPLRPVAVAEHDRSTPPAEDEPAAPPGPEEAAAGPEPTPAPQEDGERRSRWRVAAQVAAWATAIAAVAAVLLVFVFPTRTYVNQRRQLAATASELRLLNTQNSQLTDEVARLRTDTEIESIAREQYHLVRPGESAIAILPAPTPAAPATPPPPPPNPRESWLHRLTSWLP